MTTAGYTPIQDIPTYSEQTGERSSIPVHDLSRKQVTACCLLCSILNYICCPVLGIPALVFAILGLGAEKRQEIEAAKSHAFHLKVFNIICLSLFMVSFVSVVLLLILVVIIVSVISLDIRK